MPPPRSITQLLLPTMLQNLEVTPTINPISGHTSEAQLHLSRGVPRLCVEVLFVWLLSPWCFRGWTTWAWTSWAGHLEQKGGKRDLYRVSFIYLYIFLPFSNLGLDVGNEWCILQNIEDCDSWWFSTQVSSDVGNLHNTAFCLPSPSVATQSGAGYLAAIGRHCGHAFLAYLHDSGRFRVRTVRLES